MMPTHNLQIEIGAVLNGSFGATMSSGMSQLTKLGSTIKQLESSSKSIGKFQSLKSSTLSAKNEWAQAEANVKSLALEMRQVANPSNEMVASFEKSKNAASKAKQAYIEKRDALHSLGAKLKQSGVDMNSLSTEQTKLGASIDKLKTKYNDLNTLMQKRHGIVAQRAHLRGQIMDTIALGAAMAAPIKAAVDFESAMADVKKVVDFAEPDGLVKLGNTIKQISRDIPISAEGLAQITTAGGQLGVKEKDLATFTDTVAKMSTAFDMLPDEAGQAMAQLSNVFQIPMQNMNILGDAINHLLTLLSHFIRNIIWVVQYSTHLFLIHIMTGKPKQTCYVVWIKKISLQSIIRKGMQKITIFSRACYY
jgi:phage-related tail protein